MEKSLTREFLYALAFGAVVASGMIMMHAGLAFAR